MIERRGLILILSSPSGAGKTTLTRLLREGDSQTDLSISVTTRPPRPGEICGEHYHFISEEEFVHMRDTDQLLEWASVFGNLYGSVRKSVESALQLGRDILFDIDWQGAQQLYEKMPEDLVRVFILPPSAALLRKRLQSRAQDVEEVVERRMAQALNEISHWSEYDYVIVNHEIDESLAALQAIQAAERLKRKRGTGLSELVSEIQKGLP